MKKAFITGITGQDGSYLAELLLDKGYEVHGLIRRHSISNAGNISHLAADKDIIGNKLFLHYGDLTDSGSLNNLIGKIRPDEVYNLAAQSHVAISFEIPEYTADATALGTVRLLEAIRKNELDCRFYQASTSELFGGMPATAPQNENTPFHPRSPYGAAKTYSYWITANYRESYGLFACNGILFNHESPRRGENFVTRKITLAVAGIAAGRQEVLRLGNLDAMRDWGFAGDYVKAMWLMLQQDKPDDYVISSNETHTVREFAQSAFSVAGFDIAWNGSGVDEKGYCPKTGRLLVEVDPAFFRPAEVELLCGDSSKARRELSWEPKVSFPELVRMMVKSDMAEGLQAFQPVE